MKVVQITARCDKGWATFCEFMIGVHVVRSYMPQRGHMLQRGRAHARNRVGGGGVFIIREGAQQV